MKNVIGYAAAFFTTFALLPQIIRIWKLKEARDVSIFMPLMICVGASLWLVYGVMIEEMPVIAANAISLLITLITLFVTIKYR
jgi:MtN3 and saliva related transmembrane protein